MPEHASTSTPQRARCVHCRAMVTVPESYQHGDHIKCGDCGTQHKVARGEVLRLVLADLAPLRESLSSNEILVDRLEAEMRDARASLGIGVNGFAIGVAYVLYQIGPQEQPFSADLVWQALAIAIVSGIVLELANLLFLAKRQKISRLSAELEEARANGRAIEQKIREAGRI
jgi:hypothetical protein